MYIIRIIYLIKLNNIYFITTLLERLNFNTEYLGDVFYFFDLTFCFLFGFL